MKRAEQCWGKGTKVEEEEGEESVGTGGVSPTTLWARITKNAD